MKKFILFDFDGVIVDSHEPAYQSQRTRCPHLTRDDHRKRFEGNVNDHPEHEDAHTPECQLDLNFFDIYIPKMDTVPVVLGMNEVIAQLATTYTLIVISSTLTAPIQKLLDRNDLGKYFVEILGNDVHTSKVEKIKMVFKKYDVGPKDCVFITDTLGDLHEAEHMAVGAVAVTWGFHTPETLQKGKSFKLVSTPQELIFAVEEYFAIAEQ